MFHALANLPCDYGSITKSLNKRSRKHLPTATSHESIAELVMEGSHPALPAEPGTLKATLPETPCIGQMTEKESAHPAFQQVGDLTIGGNGLNTVSLKSGQMIVPREENAEQVKRLTTFFNPAEVAVYLIDT